MSGSPGFYSQLVADGYSTATWLPMYQGPIIHISISEAIFIIAYLTIATGQQRAITIKLFFFVMLVLSHLSSKYDGKWNILLVSQ